MDWHVKETTKLLLRLLSLAQKLNVNSAIFSTTGWPYCIMGCSQKSVLGKCLTVQSGSTDIAEGDLENYMLGSVKYPLPVSQGKVSDHLESSAAAFADF
ncbi:hypothetical protein Dsin_018840 [Dipteronia sinensis]|uniref:Uncharacterized protein n=1 Tax=Dipteronia sinensis TaxID=43782 RepID=A0AAE0E3G6_9ROSI|nr:hypothetical protein Dsin_018840 [Dipteronia sinensis]